MGRLCGNHRRHRCRRGANDPEPGTAPGIWCPSIGAAAMSLIGVTRNPYERTVPERILAAAAERGLAVRLIDLPTVRTEVSAAGTIAVFDQSGPITGITGLTPFLLYGFPAAVHGYRILTQTARSQNTVDGVLRADDKATTALLLASAGVDRKSTRLNSS